MLPARQHGAAVLERQRHDMPSAAGRLLESVAQGRQQQSIGSHAGVLLLFLLGVVGRFLGRRRNVLVTLRFHAIDRNLADSVVPLVGDDAVFLGRCPGRH